MADPAGPVDPAGRVEFGLDTFGDRTVDQDGQPVGYAQVIRDVVEEGILADRIGLASFNIGEHHRDDFAVSAPDVIAAALAVKTEQIRLGSAVTVLSSDDPIRVFQRFSTIDALSNGRAEVTLGRGSFTESFPLFGFDLADYERLFEEKIDLFAALIKGGPVTWQGSIHPGLSDQLIYPPTESGYLPTWVGVGGSPQSIIRAVHYGMPVKLAVIGGSPERFTPFADLYRRAISEMGKAEMPLGMHSPGYIAETDDQALNEYWPHYQRMHGRIGKERGWGEPTRGQLEHEAGPDGAAFVGSPKTVARKIVAAVDALGLQRFDMKYSMGTLPHPQLMKSIELFGTEIVPLVNEQLTTTSSAGK